MEHDYILIGLLPILPQQVHTYTYQRVLQTTTWNGMCFVFMCFYGGKYGDPRIRKIHQRTTIDVQPDHLPKLVTCHVWWHSALMQAQTPCCLALHDICFNYRPLTSCSLLLDAVLPAHSNYVYQETLANTLLVSPDTTFPT